MGRKKKLAPISGAWYQPENSGWGVLINEYHENTVTAVVFTYDFKGAQMWLNGVGKIDSDGNVEIQLYKPFAIGAFSKMTNFELGSVVGSMTLNRDADSLQFNASISTTVTNPPPNFSPALPPFFTDSGILVKI